MVLVLDGEDGAPFLLSTNDDAMSADWKMSRPRSSLLRLRLRWLRSTPSLLHPAAASARADVCAAAAAAARRRRAREIPTSCFSSARVIVSE